MNYQETVKWMFNQLPMYQSQGAIAYKKDLKNTILLAEYLENPHQNIKCIHVAGTNGKGSTSHMLASIFQEAGYKTGLYTSPHLLDFRERIKIDGLDISEAFVTKFIAKHKTFFLENKLSFFEMTVGLAFDYFNKSKVDIAIIEVGMGGRLDATNIINPIVSVITNIGLDHTQFLGTTLAEIAVEKAGIIKENIPLVIGEYTKETKPVFETIANQKNAKIVFASHNKSKEFDSDLKGNYQIKNKKTVIQTIDIINSQNKFYVSETAVQKGLLQVIKNTNLKGRWQQINSNPPVICDTAHNKHGLEIVINQVESQKYQTLHIVLGFVEDKKLDEILPLFPKNATYYFCKPNSLRGLDVTLLAQKAKEYLLLGTIYNSVSDAYIQALKKASKDDFIFIGGSTFVIAEIL